MIGYEQIEVDPNDPKIQQAGIDMVARLVDSLGVGRTTALLTFSLFWIWMTVIHCETPMAEANINNIERALDNLKSKVMDHKECALALNKETCPQKVH